MLIVLFALFLTACGGGESKPEPTATPAPTPVLQGAAKELFDLLERGLEVTYQVSYTTTSPEGEEGDTYVIFNKPPLTRVDALPAGSTAPSSILIGGDRETTTVSCSGGPGRWQCFEIEPLGDSVLKAAGPILFLSPFDLALSDVPEIDERTIAGQLARCFRLSLGDGGGEAEYCLSPFGVPLYSATEVGTVEATELSSNVSDDTFTPPAEPQQQ